MPWHSGSYVPVDEVCPEWKQPRIQWDRIKKQRDRQEERRWEKGAGQGQRVWCRERERNSGTNKCLLVLGSTPY